MVDRPWPRTPLKIQDVCGNALWLSSLHSVRHWASTFERSSVYIVLGELYRHAQHYNLCARPGRDARFDTHRQPQQGERADGDGFVAGEQ